MSIIASGTTSGTALVSTGNTNGNLVFQTNGTTTAMTIDTSQNVTLATGNLIIGTSGKGIDFSATSGTGTSELLADYEEGTWTPIQGAGLTVVGAFSSSGRYTKIGRFIYLAGRIQGATSVATTAGTIMITGIPFSIADLTAVGGIANSSLNAFGGMGAFGTTAYSLTTISATSVIDFSLTCSTT